MKQMSKVIIMAVMLVISISANAALASAMEGLDIESLPATLPIRTPTCPSI